jgi:hypothetical protein
VIVGGSIVNRMAQSATELPEEFIATRNVPVLQSVDPCYLVLARVGNVATGRLSRPMKTRGSAVPKAGISVPHSTKC